MKTSSRALSVLSSVWLGVSLLVLLFIYSSVGSAMPAVRQHRLLEMTEFEWFHWWPFDLLIGLICLNIVVVTVRRIPFRPLNYGVWMIHTGILVLAGGSVYYFGTKVEGDAPVFRRWVRIQVPGREEAEGLVVLPGNQTRVQTAEGVWGFAIQDTNCEYRLLSGEDKGQRAYAVMVQVQPPRGESFVRQLLAGYPQFTEDVLPGRGRAIKAIGQALVDESLRMSLEYEPQDWFHLASTWALYLREPGAREWTQIPLHGLPRYNAYVASRDDVLSDTPLELSALDVRVQPPTGGVNLSGATLHISGYLPYAEMRRQWLDGGPRVNPMLRVNLIEMDGAPRPLEMLALDPAMRRALNGVVEFRLLSAESQIEQLPTSPSPVLTLQIPGSSVDRRIDVTQETIVGKEGPWTPIEGTEFSYRVAQVVEDWDIGAKGTVSLAWVDLKSADKEWTRVVMDDAASSFDMPGLGFDPHAAGDVAQRSLDPRIVTQYTPSSARLIFAALPDERLFVVWNGPQSSSLRRFVRIGESVPLAPQIRVVPTALVMRAVAEVKPYVVPPERRVRDLSTAFLLSMIRLDVTSGGRTSSQWVPFSPYAVPNEQFAYPGRHPYRPVEVALADGRRIEVLFSRQRQRLPAPAALEDFELLANVGGYTGQSLSVQNWRSDVRFWNGQGWSPPQPVSVNSPTENRGFWYYQAAWDPPPQGSPGGGMNYTVLGVGNRNGVNVMLAGCCISVLGMIYAFYFKPRIQRRRKQAAPARAGAGPGEAFAGERLEPETVSATA